MQYWHALPTIWACQAGRAVYVEKPLSHYIREGQVMVRAARKYNTLVQIGTPEPVDACGDRYDSLHSRRSLGENPVPDGLCQQASHADRQADHPLPIPDSVEYDLWCGPADNGPIYRDRLQYDCSFTWDKGDGESCNQGVHEIDVARWVLQ